MAIIVGTVTFEQGADPESQFHISRAGMISQMTASGTKLYQDNGRKILRGVLIIRFVPKSKTDDFRTWLTDTAKFGQSSFTITPPEFLDIGGGAGNALTECQWDGDPTTDGAITPSGRLGRSDITITYTKVLA